MTTVRAGRLSAELAPDGGRLVVRHDGQDITTVSFAYQTTASVGARRWRAGPAKWTTGPEDEQPPPDHGWLSTGLEVVAGERAEGVIAVEVRPPQPDRVEAVAARLPAGPGERWLGFGERSDRVVRDEGVVENYVAEGPYQDYEYPFLGAFVPGWAIRQRRDATYFPVPLAVSTRGYGLSIDNDELSYFRLRPGGRAEWAAEVEAPALRFSLLAGPGPLDALGRYVALVGAQAAPEPWWFGPWYQTGHANHVPIEEERAQLDRLFEAGAPASAAETHCRYLPLGEHRGFEAEERARTAHFHERGLAVLAYLNPLLGEEYEEAYQAAAGAGAVMGDGHGGVYTFDAYAGGRTPPVTRETQYDFTSPAATNLWGAVAEQVVVTGYDGWMEDFGEYTPLDTVLADGRPAGTAGHNRYPTDFHRAADRVALDLEARHGRRLARFVRSGWTGTARHAPIVWGGDPTTGWGFDGLASAVVEGLSAGASGIAMWGSDIGGFLSSLELLTPELLCRWIEFGALSPVMRTKSEGIAPPGVVRPQIWDEEIIAVWTRWAAFHTQLNPYLNAAHARYRSTGRPIMAAMALVDPDRPAPDDQYFLGEDLVVAPVLEDGARTRRVRLPAGRWVDLWRSCRYEPLSTRLDPAGPTSFVSGDVTVPAPLDEIPVFVRAGAVLPLLPPCDSLSPYAPEVSGRRFLCFPGGAEAAFSLAGVGAGAPLSVDVTGADEGWSYEWRTATLTARSASGSIVVATCV